MEVIILVRYAVVYEVKMRNKKGEPFIMSLYNEVNATLNGNTLSVAVIPLMKYIVLEKRGEIEEDEIDDIVRNIMEVDAVRHLKKELKYVLKGSVFETIAIKLSYFRKISE